MSLANNCAGRARRSVRAARLQQNGAHGATRPTTLFVKGIIPKNCLCGFILPLLVFIMVISELGCASPTNQTTRNFPAINEYIEKRMSLFHDMRLYELRMEAVPSPEGGEVVVGGYINSQKDYNLLIRLFSSPTLNPTPAKILWKVKVDPVRAPNHNTR